MESEIILFSSWEALIRAIGERDVIRMAINNVQFCASRLGKEVFLFESRCPHFDHSLSEGQINAFGEVVCPWHSYRFDLHTGTESRQRCRQLKVWKAYGNEQGQWVVRM